MRIDKIERDILDELQQDSKQSNQELAEKLGMSVSPCWRRVRELEKAGLIKKYVAVLDRKKLGLNSCAFLLIRLRGQGAGVLESFDKFVANRPEVLECYELAGPDDFLLKVVTEDVESYARFMHQHILKLPEVDGTHTLVALRELKYETALPIPT